MSTFNAMNIFFFFFLQWIFSFPESSYLSFLHSTCFTKSCSFCFPLLTALLNCNWHIMYHLINFDNCVHPLPQSRKQTYPSPPNFLVPQNLPLLPPSIPPIPSPQETSELLVTINYFAFSRILYKWNQREAMFSAQLSWDLSILMCVPDFIPLYWEVVFHCLGVP